ncbi:hypothetical protein AK830_g7691 [Neonectria ditissima]|uniref:C3H1-type domain-containing protein n=1 Tax=Neonectria ditissima TaxID=78410 RepID=A0A0P7AZ24_9HYPO|nr:hypothetical protein AK830_g7691 [Neonectria ditissima]
MPILPDDKLDRAAERLAEYRRKDDLADILEQYATLIESYKRLKSDYEEEREGRERYKQLARGHERNPFALVIVDGDGYVFNESYVAEGEEGGVKAAKQLNDAIQLSLRQKGLESCEVMVRVYANLVGLSKCLSKNGLCGAEKRSLASFTSGFNRSYGLTDFVDAGELKENADHKMKAMLRLYADNAQCKHIYFAACHDVGYVADLTPYRGNVGLFTLIRTPSLLFHNEFNKLAMNIEEFPGVFRTTPLIPYSSYQVHASKNTSLAMGKLAAQLPDNPGQSLGGSPNEGQGRCTFYAAGKCKYGNGCKFSHGNGKMSQTELGYRALSRPHMSQSWRSSDDAPDQLNRNLGSNRLKSDFAMLPKHDDIPEGYVAVNKNGDRLDPYIPLPSTKQMKRFKEISGPTKLCNKKLLANSCYDDNCKYNHDPIPEDLKPVLELLSRTVPCPRLGLCRDASCTYGHVCQKLDCKRRGGKAPCRFPPSMCSGELELEQFVPAAVSAMTSPSMSWEDAQPTDSGPLGTEDEEDGASLLHEGDQLSYDGSVYA